MAIQETVNLKEKAVIFRDLLPEIPSTTYGTFGLYKYPAKFIPQVIAYALRTYTSPGMSVIDPFAGYGTVGTVARMCGNDYELWDLNPLLEYLHSVANMQPLKIDAVELVEKMMKHNDPYAPDWANMGYWYPEQFLPMLSRAWGFYHALDEGDVKKLLLIPLLKTTRYFSYNDEKRQKLSRSPYARKRTAKLETQDWQQVFSKMVSNGIIKIMSRLEEYKNLDPKPVNYRVRAGIDALTCDLETEHDVLITSPPYLQAQEYIRASKMDLFWLGHSEQSIRELGKKEFPYQDVPDLDIHSSTYLQCLENIYEPHMVRVYQQYFRGVLGVLGRLQEKITKNLLLFVGPATIRTNPIPIDRIFAEHFDALGWSHDETLVDTIATRAMFFYKQNPATRVIDNRMSTEHLVVLSRK